eukprot:2703-Eustigmatos_ZCMA.PRE.1
MVRPSRWMAVSAHLDNYAHMSTEVERLTWQDAGERGEPREPLRDYQQQHAQFWRRAQVQAA